MLKCYRVTHFSIVPVRGGEDGWFHPNVNIEVTFTRLRIRRVNTTLGSYVMTFQF